MVSDPQRGAQSLLDHESTTLHKSARVDQWFQKHRKQVRMTLLQTFPRGTGSPSLIPHASCQPRMLRGQGQRGGSAHQRGGRDWRSTCLPPLGVAPGQTRRRSTRSVRRSFGAALVRYVRDVLLSIAGYRNAYRLGLGLIGDQKEIQFVQEKLQLLEVRVVKDRFYTEKLEHHLLESLHRFLGSTMSLRVEFSDGIPCEPSGNHRFSVSKVSPPL